MLDIDEYYVQRTAKYAESLLDKSVQLSNQLATWALLGNVGGIAFLLSAVGQGNVPSGYPLQMGYLTFFVGAGSAFASLYLTAWLLSRAVGPATVASVEVANGVFREQLVAELEKEGIEPPASFAEADKVAETKIRAAQELPTKLKFYQWPSRVLSGVAILALGIGLALPVPYLSPERATSPVREQLETVEVPQDPQPESDASPGPETDTRSSP